MPTEYRPANARDRFRKMLNALTDEQCESLWSLVEVLLENFKPVKAPR